MCIHSFKSTTNENIVVSKVEGIWYDDSVLRAGLKTTSYSFSRILYRPKVESIMVAAHIGPI